MSRHKSKVDDLGGDPQRPKRLTAFPDLIAPFVVGMFQRMCLPLNHAFHSVEGWEVDEGMTAVTQKKFQYAVQTCA